MKFLVTGGTGYIGSHAVIELLKNDCRVILFDNLSNSDKDILPRIEEISGKSVDFIEGDLRNISDIEKVFKNHSIDAVIHFAGLKAVGESCEKPLLYYENNISGTINLCQVMKKYGCKKLVFSSSATVYGDTAEPPFKENFPTGIGISNPYGRTKFMIENILSDLYNSDKDWSICLLRYFNPVGAHESGKIGEKPNGKPNNLMPFVTQVAVGIRDKLSVFGNDYNTPDGTCIRDYIHISDLARGHCLALNKLFEKNCLYTYNLGTGKGYSVLEFINTFEEANGIKIPFEIVDRRSGDVEVSYSDTEKARVELDFVAEKSLAEMCRDSYNWQIKNINGYKD